MPAPKSSGGAKRSAAASRRPATKAPPKAARPAEPSAAPNLNPLNLVMLTRDRIQETLDDAAKRGRVTRTDANELVSELVRRGRQQTDDLLADIEQLLGRGRDQIGGATKRARRADPVDKLVRGAGRARRNVDGRAAFPIPAYDDLTARQVSERLRGLTLAELRKVRDFECRHANRKSVLGAIEKRLG